MRKVIVGVMRGGPSNEYEVSLRTGANVLANLPEGYEGHDVLITKNGEWHIDGISTTPAELASRVDVLFNAMHGKFGEDGKVQQMLDVLKIPYTGSGTLASSITMNKLLAKEAFGKVGIRTPRAIILKRGNSNAQADEIFKEMNPPWVVKPASGGSSIGMSIVRLLSNLPEAISLAFEHGDNVIIEEYIRGKEATAGVIDNFRGKAHYALLPVEIRPHKNRAFFDYDAKYAGARDLHSPAVSLTAIEKKVLEDIALKIHRLLNLRHYSRSDFIVSPRGIYTLEVNSLPELTDTSPFAHSLKSVGIKYNDFLKHVIDIAIAGI